MTTIATKPLQQRFWFLCMDAFDSLGRLSERLYLCCVGKASDCEDWGEVSDEPNMNPPF